MFSTFEASDKLEHLIVEKNDREKFSKLESSTSFMFDQALTTGEFSDNDRTLSSHLTF